jgi:hypothetical protein
MVEHFVEAPPSKNYLKYVLANATRVLEEAAKKIGLEITIEKTKIMELIESGEDPSETENLAYKKVSDFKYLGATLSTKND